MECIQCSYYNKSYMTIILRVALAALFGYLAFLVFMQPSNTESYIRMRYSNLRYFLLNLAPSFALPEKLFTGLSPLFFRVTSLFLVVGAVVTLLNKKIPILLYGYFVLIVGGALHIPLDTKGCLLYTSDAADE
eukprot:TRINITY_DN7046_c0_g2_i3.p1 TRINITY_DN7046_c0_g2~~TRINITY_DN7046_c0_g2_i3.p1  ORF type:complete len:133 (-),score=32.68 TRINITY_DN7046_c0_g2_i3:29-427(-)